MTRNIKFAPGVVPEADKGMVDSVLKRLPPDVWGEGNRAILVRRRFSGAGGAMVLQIEVSDGNAAFFQVVKIGPAEEMRAEHEAFDRYIKRANNQILTQILYATDGVHAASPHELEALVYGYVGQFAGDPGAALPTLEDVFAAASRGSTTAARRAGEAIDELFTGAKASLYLHAAGTGPAMPLLTAVPRLGPDLTLTVLHVADRQGRTVWGTRPAESKPMYERNIWRAGAGHQDTGPWVRPVTIDDLVLKGDVGSFETASVKLNGELPVEDGTFQVTGLVASTRPDVVMKDLPALPADQTVDPFAALRAALDVELVRVGNTTVHGDLNARNVLLVGADHDNRMGSRPYLIDYRESTDELTLLSDFAWLEINLMRAIADEPPLADLLRLQRLVTLASALLPDPETNQELDLTPFAEIGRSAGPLWPILVRLRWHAYRCYPAAHRDNWLADHARHLVMAAHRTFKWPGARSMASLATAGVAGEWLTPQEAFRFWSALDLTAVPGVLAATAGQSPRFTALLLGALTGEADRRRSVDLEKGLTTAANTLVAAVSRPLDDIVRQPFMDLSVTGANAEVLPAVEHLTGTPYGVLAGPAGSGKSAVIGEMAIRMSTVADNTATLSDRDRHRLPVVVTAADLPGDGIVDEQVIARRAPVRDPRLVGDLLHAGCLHVLADGVAPAGVAALRGDYPRTYVLVCGRETVAGTAVHRLLPPTADQAITFLAESAVRGGVPLSVLRDALAGQGTARVDELLGTALGVTLLARHLRPNTKPGLTDLLDESFAGLASHETALRTAERIAADQVDHRRTWTPDDQADRGDLEVLRDHGVLERTAHGWSFTRAVYRDYLAGRDTTAAVARSRWLSWQEALRLAVSRTGAEQVSAAVVGAVRHTDPVFAARLLAMTATTDPEFAHEQVTALRDGRSGHVARRIAAEALRALGEPGIKLLCEVALDAGQSPAVRYTAVQPLLDGEPALGPHPVRLAAQLLGETPQPPRLRTTGVQLAVRHRATQLTVLIAGHCDEQAPWPYWQAAHNGLRSLGTVIPRRLNDQYRAAAARRLDRLTAILPRLTRRATYTSVQEERVELLHSPLRGRHDVLLAHRHDFEIGEQAADLLPDPPARDPLTETDVDQLLALEHRTAAENERLATALVDIWANDPVQGARLAERTHAALVASNSPDRLRWPIRVALARCGPDDETVESLLASGAPDDQALAVAALSAAGFPLDASASPSPALSEPARHAVLSLMPEPTACWAAVDFLRAAAAAGITEALPLARRLLDEPGLGEMTRLIPHAAYGVLCVSARSEVLSAGGFLLSIAPGSPLAGHIEGLDLSGGHPSDETGRLIALAYLGKAETVLDALNGAEPRLHAVARHAVTMWATGDWRDPDSARDAIATRLRTGQHDPHARSTLLELLRELSERSGRLTGVPVHGPM